MPIGTGWTKQRHANMMRMELAAMNITIYSATMSNITKYKSVIMVSNMFLRSRKKLSLYLKREIKVGLHND